MNQFSADVQWAGMTADTRGDIKRAIEHEKWLKTEEGREWARDRDAWNCQLYQRELEWFYKMLDPVRSMKYGHMVYDLAAGEPDRSFASFWRDGVIEEIIPNPRDLLSFGGAAWGMTKSAVDQRGEIHYIDRRDSIDDPKKPLVFDEAAVVTEMQYEAILGVMFSDRCLPKWSNE